MMTAARPAAFSLDPGDVLFAGDRSRPAVNGLLRAAAHLDVDAVADAVAASIAEKGVMWTWERLIRPVWTHLGRVDEAAGAVIAERLFSQAISQVLTAVRRPHDRASAPVLLACADEEHHTLPLDALAAALAELRTSSCVLGARVPPQAVAAAVGRLRPAVVAVWSQTRDTADPRQVTSLLTVCPGPAVIAAGPGWNTAGLPAGANPSADVAAALQQTRTLLCAPIRPDPDERHSQVSPIGRSVDQDSG